MRQKMDVVELKSIANGYEFRLGEVDYRLRFEDGAWRLMRMDEPESSLFESFNEALNFALETGAIVDQSYVDDDQGLRCRASILGRTDIGHARPDVGQERQSA
jgi:hypothetical protein